MNLSICLASYNGERFIKDQIDSILPQLKEGDELLVGDDGSSDGTLNIVNEYGSKISRIIASKAGGVNQNFERLIVEARNLGIVLSDQDDVWLPGRLELIREALKTSALVITNGHVVDESLNPTGISIFEFVNYRRGFLKNYIKNSYVGCCMAFNRGLLENVIPFNKKLYAHDWFIGLLGEIDGHVSVINEFTILYRRHKTNASATGLKSKNNIITKIKIRFEMAKILLANYASISI
jgi:glycosyltransferase involved in cell wall biosynthesis